ncbi:UDP-Glycosyltransferase/glycogen phosphorylase [Rhizophagus irregularis]|nr:UDP-Glycosyltransferase/glycogen phosphorylase [Rhizophagus irregularis]
MRYNIAMVSDFFYPNMGGVESHLYQLSQRLIQRGHKIIIITHSYGNRTGIRYLTNGLKVYYVPHMVIYSEATLPTIYGFFPIFRNIVKREKIDIVHGHQAFSSLCHEAILHSRTMGMKACFTDHSLFGFADASSILTNKLLKFTLSDIDHVICVSHTSKENTVLRAALNPQMVSVIPNAVVASQFKPDPGAQDPNFITIVVASRLVYRKGMDLLVAAIPRICQMHSKVKFIIGGDGPKRIDLEQMREKYLLHDRVELVGTLMQHEVRNLLTKGHIFLNTSLTEAFCIGIVEAACCGLLVVSTKVGGVPEVLPKHMIIFAKPEEDDLVNAVGRAIEMIRLKEVIPIKFHDEIKEMYSWVNVAERTEKVSYDAIWKMRIPPLMERLRRYYGCGLWAGKIFCILIAIDYLIWRFLEWLFPEEDIEIAPAFPYQKYNKIKMMMINNYFYN